MTGINRESSTKKRNFVPDSDELYNERQMKEYERATSTINQKRSAGRKGGASQAKAKGDPSTPLAELVLGLSRL